jgi:hypothetical protein
MLVAVAVGLFLNVETCFSRCWPGATSGYAAVVASSITRDVSTYSTYDQFGSWVKTNYLRCQQQNKDYCEQSTSCRCTDYLFHAAIFSAVPRLTF